MSLIDKQKTYEVLTDYYHHSTEQQHKALREALDRVPDAEIAADTISRKKTLERLTNISYNLCKTQAEDKIIEYAKTMVITMPSAQPKIVQCKDCKHWRQQTNYAGALLSFGFCESDDMWRSLYGETCEISHIDTDDDFYCGYAERRTDE